MSWKEIFQSCFGPVDKKFLSHPIEKKRAEKLLEELIENRVTKNELREMTREWLESEGCHIEHINEQIIKVGKWFDEAIKGKKTKQAGSSRLLKNL